MNMNGVLRVARGKVKQHKTLIENFSYLGLLQVLNLIIPLVTYPYLIRVLGKELYGLVIFAQAIIGYLQILVSFGFNVSATKDVSINRDNKEKLSEIVSSVFIIKGLLFLVSILLLFSILFFIPDGKNQEILFYLSMWLCFYDWIFPIWYFQGIEKMKYITYFTLISRLSFVILIFVFIKNADHYLRLPVINGVGALLSGGGALIIIFKNDQIKFKFQKIVVLKKYFYDSISLFISGVSVKIFVQANKVLIGWILGMGEVAYYDLAEKIINVLKMPQVIISQVIFPKVSKEKNKKFLIHMISLSAVVALGLVGTIQFFSNEIVILIGGKQMLPAVKLLRVFSITILLVYVSQYTSMHTLLANGYNNKWMRVIVHSGVLYLIIVSILFLFDVVSSISLIYATLISELYLLIRTFYLSKKLKLL